MEIEEGKMGMRCAGCGERVCRGCRGNMVNSVISNKNRGIVLPEGFFPDGGESGYGIVFDIGTTTLAGLLWDLESGKLENVSTRTNPQTVYGADVISRIGFALKGGGNVGELQQLILECINGMIEELMGGVRKKIKRIMVAGNSTMCHLVLGISPEGLARAPFRSAYEGIQKRKGEKLGIRCAPESDVFILPGIGGHVGSDMSSVLLYVQAIAQEGYNLILDVGTNGEIALIGEGKIITCSTAAGPALEGAAVYQGMRGAKGAIEGVGLKEGRRREGQCEEGRWEEGYSEEVELVLQVIGGGTPMGICGSGLVDALSVLLAIGVMDETGYLLHRQEAMEAGVSDRWAGRLIEWEKQSAFVLYEGERERVVLTAQDIRQLQLAKGAIRAGAEVLLTQMGITAKEIDGVYLAGAFGNYIRKESAVRIGLLPIVKEEKIHAIGNGAGIGASMALMSKKDLADMGKYAEMAVHVELADEESFQELFMESLNF